MLIVVPVAINPVLNCTFRNMCQLIRPSCVVIIFTNYPYPQYRKKCMEAGADFFFDKSMEFEKIPEVLGQLVLEAKMKDKKGK